MPDLSRTTRFSFKPHLWLINFVGLIVPRRLRSDWRQEWEAELRYREALLADWERLNWRARLELLRRSLGAFFDALWLQRLRWEDDMIQDLRYGVRMLLNRPGFSVLAIVALAVGIGPITAIFSLINGLLIRPLPYSEPDRLVMVWRTNPERGFREFPISVPNFLDLRDRDQVFASVSGLAGGNLSLGGEGEPEMVEGASVSAEFLSTIGVQPVLGRGFESGEEKPGAAPVVLLSHALWTARFGGDPNAIGKSLFLEGESRQIIGVLPAGLEFPSTAQLWVPLTLDPQESGRGSNFLSLIGRLKPEVTIEQATAQWNTVSEQLEKEYPQFNAGARVEMVPLKQQAVGAVEKPLLILFGAIGMVLLIACANVANLLLARTAGRQRELAVRAALGASRLRLVRQLLTEGLLLAALGGTAGVLIAGWTRDLLLSLNPFKISRVFDGGLDLRILGFTAGVALLTGVVFGLIPAFHSMGKDLSKSIKETAGPSYGGSVGQRLRGTLVVAEVALSLVLLIGAGLLIRSFVSLRSVNPGFNPEGVLTLNLTLTPAYMETNKRSAFVRQVTERLKAIPGARDAASAAYVPMAEMRTSRRFAISGQPLPEPGKEPFAVELPVGPGYFSLLGIPVLAGRDFSGQETMANPETIINESFAQRFFPGENAVGKRIRFYSASPQAPPPPWIEIVGIAGNVNQAGPAQDAEPIIYSPQLVRPWSFMSFLVKTEGNPSLLAASARSAVAAVDNKLAVSKVAALEEVMSRKVVHQRGLMALVGAFAAVALLLAMTGIYGVLSYAVSQRTHEIGVRMAIGAQRRDVVGLVIKQGMSLTAVGTAIGLLGGFGLESLLGGLLYGVGARDPFVFAGVALLVAGVAFVACYIPARRATKIDPITALRHE